MGEFVKKHFVAVAIIVATIILAGIGVFTAIKLYQLRQESVVPTVPQSQPRAAIGTPTPTPRATSTATPKATGSATPSPSGSPKTSGSPSPTATSRTTTIATDAPIPQSGVGTPTVLAFGAGILLLIGALFLAF